MKTLPFKKIHHQVDFCVVGGGLAGTFAAISAARMGKKVLLMQDRPMLGGNASSEIRMWICGAHGSNLRETGLLEEMELENLYRNADRNYSVRDYLLYEMAQYQDKLTLLLNCSCLSCEMKNGRIESVCGWQTTTQQYHNVCAELFADCSGDSVLAPLTGAQFRIGRESSSEYGESLAPEDSDTKTMGLSCLIQARQLSQPDTFIAPSWAAPITKESLAPYRLPNMDLPHENYWYLELGGDRDSINDTEVLRKELLEEAMGLWNYIKNDPENVEKNRFWHLDWIGFLPGKRESRRYVGDYTIHQNDVINQTAFDDIVAYGGWSMDTHHPSGMRTKEKPTIYHAAPSPYGIPYRCLYSVNVPNLMFAGRNISCTHMAFSSCRVMATCAIMGQAIGTAAALCLEKDMTPRALSLSPEGVAELKQTLMKDDCYLPGQRRMLSAVMGGAEISGVDHADQLLNGVDRPEGDADNGCYVKLGEGVVLHFPQKRSIHQLRLVFDSDLDRVMPYDEERTLKRSSLCNRPLNCPDVKVPETLVREFRVDILDENGGWKTVCLKKECHQRLVYVPLDAVTDGIRFVPLATWGAEDCHLFALEAE